MLIKTLSRFVIVFLIFICCILLLQSSVMLWIAKTPHPPKKADLIAVFPGSRDRVAAGHLLAAQSLAPNLLIAGFSSGQMSSIPKTYGELPNVNFLASGKSRSTFEDAYNAVEVIKNNHFDSVVLVTSSWHMPRALFLLKTLLHTSSLHIDISYYSVEPGEKIDTSTMVFLYCNEIVKFWGSVIEMIGFLTTSTFLTDSPFFLETIKEAKKIILLKIPKGL